MQELIDSINNKKIFLAKGLLKNTPEWKDFIELLSNKYNTPSTYEWHEQLVKNLYKDLEDRPTDILISRSLDPIVFRVVEFNDNNYILNEMPKASSFVELFSNIFKHYQIKAIMNFVGNESMYSAHKDDHDVVSWHCIGTMEWRIYPDFSEEEGQDPYIIGDKPYDSYILEPGDVIYIPKNTAHRVVVENPRASLILQTYN
jgi:ribosomal protein L16 Arg81 hydroxylase